MAQIEDLLNQKREFLAQRKDAYCRTFSEENLIAQWVLDDLDKFCRGSESTFHPDPYMHALLEGRREVYLRILNHIEMSLDQLWDLHNNKRGRS